MSWMILSLFIFAFKHWMLPFLYVLDFLLFKACIPHCISSRCTESDEIMCVSIYLKSAVIGMNNNGLELNEKQAVLAKRYHQLEITQLMSPSRQHHLSVWYQKFYNNL